MTAALRFRRVNRMRQGAEFQRCYKEGSRARAQDLLVVVLPNGREDSRLGLSVGKRVWKSAVKRNRVRRVFREAFRLSLPELPKGIDVVMIPARPALAPNALAVRAELLKLAPKALRRYHEKTRASAEAGGEAGTQGSGGASAR